MEDCSFHKNDKSIPKACSYRQQLLQNIKYESTKHIVYTVMLVLCQFESKM